MKANLELQHEIEVFLYNEAELLDSYEYNEWLKLFTDDIEYKMPVRLNKERNDQQGDDYGESSDMYHFLENKKTLDQRVERLYTKFAWAEDPPSRTRRLITNVRIKENSGNPLLVYSSFLLYRNRGTDATYELISGERRDVLIKMENEWRIDKRLILIDQATLGLKNLAVFF